MTNTRMPDHLHEKLSSKFESFRQDYHEQRMINGVFYHKSNAILIKEDSLLHRGFKAGYRQAYSDILQELWPVVAALRNYDYDSNGKPAREALKHLKERILNEQ